ncbi:hypothetical protein AX16_003455 [Volvariella volvacea WC 439]|nr:hypothetical protein AX16_003455 [Volvariella volvacea WC 439]
MSTQASSSVPQRPQKSRSNLNGNTGQRSSRTSGVASTQSSATSKLPDPMAMTSSIDQDLGVLVNPSSAPPSKLGPSAPAPPGTSLSTSTTSTSSFSSLLANFNSKFVVSSTTITSNPIPEQSSSSAGARATPLAAAIGRTEWDSEVGSVETVCSTPTKVSVSLPSNSSSLTSPTLTRDNVSTNSEDADSDLGSRKQVGFLTYMKEWEELEVGAKKVKEPGVKDTDGRVRVRPGEMRIKMGKAGGRVKSKMRVEVVVPPSAAAKAAAVIKPVKESGKGRKEKGASDSVGMEEITKTMSTRVGVPPLVTTAAPGVQSTLASTPVHAPTAASSSFKLQETPKATTSGTNAVTSSAITTPIAKPPAEPFIDLSLTKPKTKRRRISGGSAAFSLSKSTPDAKFSGIDTITDAHSTTYHVSTDACNHVYTQPGYSIHAAAVADGVDEADSEAEEDKDKSRGKGRSRGTDGGRDGNADRS